MVFHRKSVQVRYTNMHRFLKLRRWVSYIKELYFHLIAQGMRRKRRLQQRFFDTGPSSTEYYLTTIEGNIGKETHASKMYSLPRERSFLAIAYQR
jgi:hypothetical protein